MFVYQPTFKYEVKYDVYVADELSVCKECNQITTNYIGDKENPAINLGFYCDDHILTALFESNQKYNNVRGEEEGFGIS